MRSLNIRLICCAMIVALCALCLSGCVLVPRWSYNKEQGWSGPEWVQQEDEKSDLEKHLDRLRDD
jgi:hypothetical protein